MLKTTRRRLGEIDFLGITGLVVLIGLWYLATLWVSRSSLPYPHTAVIRAYEDFGDAPQLAAYGIPDTGLASNLWYTAQNVFIAVGIGAVIGTLIGLIAARFAVIRAIVSPILLTAGTVPILIAAPFFLVWFGVGRSSSVLLITIYTVMLMIVYSMGAARNLDPVYESNARTLGARPKDVVKDVLIPGTTPEVLGGLRIAFAGAWGLEAFAELLGSERGIGQVIRVIAGSFDATGILAALVVIAVAAVALDWILVVGINRLLRWRTP